jgi:hypothetical protein
MMTDIKPVFLCPKCGVSITSDGLGDMMAWEKRKGRRLFTTTVGLMVLGYFIWDNEFKLKTGISWSIVGGIAVLASVVVIYALNKKDPEIKILRTKYVDKAMATNIKSKQPWES